VDELVQCESILSTREELVTAALEAHLRSETLLAVHRPRLLGSDEAEQLELDHDGALPCQKRTSRVEAGAAIRPSRRRRELHELARFHMADGGVDARQDAGGTALALHKSTRALDGHLFEDLAVRAP